MAASLRWVLLLLTSAAVPAAHAQLALPTWPPLSGSGTCNNAITDAMLSMFSPNSAFSTVAIGALTYVNSTFICPNVSYSEVQILLSTIKIYLCYGPTTTDCQIESLANISKLLTGGHWNNSRGVTCFIPGWTKSATSVGYSDEVIKAYHTNGQYNLLVVEWSTVNTNEYTRVVSLLPAVARALASALEDLARASGGVFSSCVLVGHSLGAHLAGYVARLLRNSALLVIAMVAALDPAGPCFEASQYQCQEGVLSTDAPFVMALHTDCGRFGTSKLIGSVDYFANEGFYTQPGCSPYDTNPTACAGQFLCSHVRAVFFWCAGIRLRGSVVARRCPSYSHFRAGACAGYPTWDITLPTNDTGSYFFKTNPDYPFGMGLDGA